MATALVLFALTYLLIAVRRLRLLHIGRPAGALVGGVAMVLFGVLSPREAYAAVDLATLGLLFGMMVITAYLGEAGFFNILARAALERTADPRILLAGVVWVSGLASALLVNDTVCLMMTPLVALLATSLRLDPLPFLLALATSSNIGSVATLTGNPQNMIIGTASGIPYRQYLFVMGPIAVLCLALNHALLYAAFKDRLGRGDGAAPAEGPHRLRRPLLWKSLLTLGLVVGGWLGGTDLSFTAVAGAALLILAARFSPARILERLDWSLLLFFAGLFVVMAGVRASGASGAVLSLLPLGSGPLHVAAFTLLSVAGSNLFSNVPFVLAAAEWVGHHPDARFFWLLLALTSTFAGNLTLVGSMANLIVAELAKGVHHLGFREYLRFGLVTTAVTTAAGVLLLSLLFALGAL